MNELLLDTHVLIWLMQDNPRISEYVFERIRSASLQHQVVVSAITPWEIALLVSKGKIDLQMDAQAWNDQVLALPGIRLQPLLPQIAVASTRLPWEMHPDPADRILAATARHLRATLVTADDQILRYATHGHLRCLAAHALAPQD